MLTAENLRRLILDEAHRAREGHIGSALSVVEIMVVLYRDVLDGLPDGADRDRVVLSKGHAALALYGALHLAGHLSRDSLSAYAADGSLLGVHPQHGIAGVEFTTGSLGQGITFAAGCALGAKLKGAPWHTYAVCSDAECDEGSVWEAAAFAAHHHLDNLAVVVDDNHQQAMGATSDILSLGDLASRWAHAGWRTIRVDGHDEPALATALRSVGERRDPRPLAVIATTVFGKGVDFMERQLRWHYSSMSDADHARAVAALGGNR